MKRMAAVDIGRASAATYAGSIGIGDDGGCICTKQGAGDPP